VIEMSRCPPEIELITSETARVSTNGVRMNAMIQDIGRFLGGVLSMRCSCSVDTHTDPSARRRAIRLKDGAQLHELMQEDGIATTDLGVCSGRIMRMIDEQRTVDENMTNRCCVFVGCYIDFLENVEMLCLQRSAPKDVIDFKLIVVGPKDDGSGEDEVTVKGYFQSVSIPCPTPQLHGCTLRPNRRHGAGGIFHDASMLSVGRFADGVANSIHDTVSTWIESVQTAISASYPDCANPPSSSMLATAKSVLCKLISSHVSMQDCFDVRLSRVCENITAKNLEAISKKLIAKYRSGFDAHKESLVEQLSIMRDLFTISDVYSLVGVVQSHQESILSGLRLVDALLERSQTHGFGTVDASMDQLAGIVRSTLGDAPPCTALLAAQILNWRSNIDLAARERVCQVISAQVAALRKQSLDNYEFIPTLRGLKKLPNPEWTHASDLAQRVRRCVASQLPRNTNGACCFMNMSPSMLMAIRIVSLVWELAACETTNDACFAQGRVRARFIGDVVTIHKVSAVFAMTLLRSRLQEHQIGQNYRNAVSRISSYRGSMIENDIRLAVRCVAKWKLEELMAVCSEHSPVFEYNLAGLTNATIQSIPGAPMIECNSVVVRALMSALPVLVDVRSEASMGWTPQNAAYADLLLSIPSIREWTRDSDELVLEIRDVSKGIHGAVGMLKELSKQRHIVSFQRRGTKNVFVFNRSDLMGVMGPERPNP
jgi:hypothetical protein